MNNKEVDMLNGNFMKKIIVFAIPVMLSSILQLLFNACDLIVVGKFAGDDSLAAVGSTTSLVSLIVNLFIGFSVGANVVIARSIGKKDKEKCEKVVHTSILFSLLIGVVVTLFGVLASRFCLEKMDTPSEIIGKASTYLSIYFLGSIFNLVYNFGASILRAIGETRKPLIYLFIAGVTNALLNLFLVIVCKMDVAGVAIATVISQVISAVLVIRCLMKTEGYIHLNIRKLKIDKKSLGEIVLIGLPAGIQNSLFAISNISIQKAVNSFKSTAVVAGNSASSNIGNFIYSSMNSFYQACLTFTSQNYGAKKIKNCKKVLLSSLLLVTLVGIAVGGIAVIFGKPLLGLYTNGSDSIEYGLIRLTIIGLTYFTCGIVDVLVGGLRGLGYSITPMIVSILGICVLRIVWIHTVFKANHTLQVLYISYPLSWVVTSLIHMICYICIYNKLKNKINKDLQQDIAIE